ncbi:hypothetical protein P4V41_07455 [Fictibacillus nanhaiensis]|uniref:hypothetical protein n=1 Tax=Fictibacillus nanhaiensis TaxID=742169 RepID=UPI002E1EA56C|nr:hypothetical protein [Fictibacillus nanhaiensis]
MEQKTDHILTKEEIYTLIENAKTMSKGEEFSDLIQVTYTNALRLVQVLNNIDKVYWKDITTKNFTLTKAEVFKMFKQLLDVSGIDTKGRHLSWHSIRSSRIHHLAKEMKIETE